MKSKILKYNDAYQHDVDQLVEELGSSNDSILNMAAMDGGWSAIQTMHHLILVEELALQYVRKKLSFGADLPKVDFQARFRTAMLWFYLRLPVKFKAPAAVNEDKLPGFTTFAKTKERWENIRREWTEFLQQLPEELQDKTVYRHVFLGRLSWPGMLRFFHFHFQRHRKQIWRTLGR